MDGFGHVLGCDRLHALVHGPGLVDVSAEAHLDVWDHCVLVNLVLRVCSNARSISQTRMTKRTSENSVWHIPGSRLVIRTAVPTKSALKFRENVRTNALVPP